MDNIVIAAVGVYLIGAAVTAALVARTHLKPFAIGALSSFWPLFAVVAPFAVFLFATAELLEKLFIKEETP